MEDHEDCHVEPVEKPLDREALSSAKAAYLVVRGMGCPRCAMRVRNGLLIVDGVILAEVFLERGVAAAIYDPDRVAPDDLLGAVAAAGNDGRHEYRAGILAIMPASEALEE